MTKKLTLSRETVRIVARQEGVPGPLGFITEYPRCISTAPVPPSPSGNTCFCTQ